MPRVHFPPTETVVNVLWGGGVFLLIDVWAIYHEGTVGSRRVELIVTSAGNKLGMKILGQKHFDESNPELKFTRYRAVMQIARRSELKDVLYSLKLTGAETFIDPAQPPPLVPAFCGTHTISTSWGMSYLHPTVIQHGIQLYEWRQDWIIQETSPAGSGSLSGTSVLSGGREIENSPAGSRTSSFSSIWYQDGNGNWRNTGLPCEQLPNFPADVGTKKEGFDHITIQIWPKKGFKVQPVASWDTNSPIIVPVPNGPENYGGPSWETVIPQTLTGKSAEDLSPIYEDLMNGSYDFNFHELAFTNNPPTDDIAKPFKTAVTYPMTLNPAKYSVKIAKTKPYKQYRPPMIAGDEKLFPLGAPPPATEAFEPI